MRFEYSSLYLYTFQDAHPPLPPPVSHTDYNKCFASYFRPLEHNWFVAVLPSPRGSEEGPRAIVIKRAVSCKVEFYNIYNTPEYLVLLLIQDSNLLLRTGCDGLEGQFAFGAEERGLRLVLGTTVATRIRGLNENIVDCWKTDSN